MNDVENNESSPKTYSHDEGSGSKTKLILGLVLVAVVAAACYEYFLVRLPFEAASKKLDSMQQLALDENGLPLKTEDGRSRKIGDVDLDGDITPDDVHKTLGVDPAETVEVTETGFYERYSWRGVSNKEVFVLYNKMKEDGKAKLFSIKNKTPDEKMFRKRVVSDPSAPAPSAGGGPAPPSDDKKADDKKEDAPAEEKAEAGSDKKSESEPAEEATEDKKEEDDSTDQ